MTTRKRRPKQAPDSSPVARLQQAAADFSEHGLAEGLEELGRQKDSDKPTIGGTPRQRQTGKSDTEQS